VQQLELKRINDKVSVSPQISPDDIADIKAAGFVAVVNNRPDGEAPDQPSGSEIQAAAEAAGLSYTFIPMGREGVTPDMVAKTRAALADADGPVFCYCRSGTRSTTLWALSQAGEMDAGAIISAAAHAGYDISHLAGHLDQSLS
jgi:uncharacterized protein (TIGR01244 family)